MGNLFSEKIWGIPWSLLALAALVVAMAYTIIDTSHGTTGFTFLVLRWFHSLCWLFLALAALAMARITPLPQLWAGPLAVAGGITYGVFVITGMLTGTLFK